MLLNTYGIESQQYSVAIYKGGNMGKSSDLTEAVQAILSVKERKSDQEAHDSRGSFPGGTSHTGQKNPEKSL